MNAIVFKKVNLEILIVDLLQSKSSSSLVKEKDILVLLTSMIIVNFLKKVHTSKIPMMLNEMNKKKRKIFIFNKISEKYYSSILNGASL